MHLLSSEEDLKLTAVIERFQNRQKTSTIEAGLVTAKTTGELWLKKGQIPIRMRKPGTERYTSCQEKIEGGPGIAVYSPQGLDAEKDFQISQQVRVLVDHRDISDLGGQFDDAVNQLLFRSHSGDQEAAKLLIKKLESALLRFKTTDGKQFSTPPGDRWKVIALACDVKSENAGHFEREAPVDRFKNFAKLYAAALLVPHPKDRTESFWFQLAKQACEVCEFNRNVVPYFQIMRDGLACQN